MIPIRIPSREAIRAACQQGEEAVIALIEPMAQTLLLLGERVQVLEDWLAKNNRNSSKPPSGDGLSQPAPKSQRKRHGKKSGGQPGHEVHTLKAVDHPDRIEVHRVKCCRHCQVDLEGAAVQGYEKRQVFHLRELEFLKERYPQERETSLVDLLLEIKEQVEKAKNPDPVHSPSKLPILSSALIA